MVCVTRTTTSIAGLILDEVAPLLGRAKAAWATRCQERDLSMTHFQALTLLDRSGPIPMSHLAEQMGVSLPNATGIITRMEERGVVERAHDEHDRRLVLVRLTPPGQDFIRELGDLRRAQLTALIDAMAPEQQENLLRAIRDVLAVLPSTTEERSPA